MSLLGNTDQFCGQRCRWKAHSQSSASRLKLVLDSWYRRFTASRYTVLGRAVQGEVVGGHGQSKVTLDL